MPLKTPLIVWIQCTPQGKPIFCTAASLRLRSRQLLKLYLYPGEDVSWVSMKADGVVERQFKVEEIKGENEDTI